MNNLGNAPFCGVYLGSLREVKGEAVFADAAAGSKRKIMSGKLSTGRSEFLCSQPWPHRTLDQAMFGEQIEYRNLTLAQVGARFTAIILGEAHALEASAQSKLKHLNCLLTLTAETVWSEVLAANASSLKILEQKILYYTLVKPDKPGTNGSVKAKMDDGGRSSPNNYNYNC